MISSVNGTASHSFFIPPASTPTAPIPISAITSQSITSQSFPGYTSSPHKDPPPPVVDEVDPSEKELAALLNAEGGLSVVDRVASFKVIPFIIFTFLFSL